MDDEVPLPYVVLQLIALCMLAPARNNNRLVQHPSAVARQVARPPLWTSRCGCIGAEAMPRARQRLPAIVQGGARVRAGAEHIGVEDS